MENEWKWNEEKQKHENKHWLDLAEEDEEKNAPRERRK